MMLRRKGSSSPAASLLKGRRATPVLGSHWSVMPKTIGRSLLSPRPRRKKKRACFAWLALTFREVPAVPYSDPGNYVRVSGRIAEEMVASHPHGAIWANQFDNVANRQAHYEGTGPEIWEQLDGKIDGFTCAVGTGGTIAGTGMFLKERNKDIKIALSDPMGSALFHHYKHGELKAEGTSITEGIGQGRITKNLEGAPIDEAYQISDEEALPVVFDLLKYEGLCMGTSSAINIAGAIRLAKELGPGHTIVTILCDYGTRYQSKMFNVEFLKSKGLPNPRLDELIRARQDGI